MAHKFEQHWVKRTGFKGGEMNSFIWPLEKMIWNSLIDIAMHTSMSVEEGTENMIRKMVSFQMDSSFMSWYQIKGELIST